MEHDDESDGRGLAVHLGERFGRARRCARGLEGGGAPQGQTGSGERVRREREEKAEQKKLTKAVALALRRGSDEP